MLFGPRHRRRNFFRVTVALVAVLLALSAYGSVLDVGAASVGPAHHVGKHFRNPSADYSYTLLERTRYLLFGRHLPKPRVGLAAVPNDGRELGAASEAPRVTWIGHATFLVQVDGVNLLTDPHWGDTASPVPFAGPRRLTPPGVRFEALPPIHAVLVSHDHYDHLDLPTVQRLAREHDPTFFVPMGLKAWLAAEGVLNVVELDWWDERELRGLRIVCTPSQHSSGRNLHDQNRRLWASWAVEGRARKVYFAGDTGYTPAFRDIARLGPFDLVLAPIGGYSGFHRRHPNHVSPEEAVQLFEDVDGRLMVPMHWGTFDMNREPVDEPPRRVLAEALRRGIEEHVAILSPGQTIPF